MKAARLITSLCLVNLKTLGSTHKRAKTKQKNGRRQKVRNEINPQVLWGHFHLIIKISLIDYMYPCRLFFLKKINSTYAERSSDDIFVSKFHEFAALPLLKDFFLIRDDEDEHGLTGSLSRSRLNYV